MHPPQCPDRPNKFAFAYTYIYSTSLAQEFAFKSYATRMYASAHFAHKHTQSYMVTNHWWTDVTVFCARKNYAQCHTYTTQTRISTYFWGKKWFHVPYHARMETSSPVQTLVTRVSKCLWASTQVWAQYSSHIYATYGIKKTKKTHSLGSIRWSTTTLRECIFYDLCVCVFFI